LISEEGRKLLIRVKGEGEEPEEEGIDLGLRLMWRGMRLGVSFGVVRGGVMDLLLLFEGLPMYGRELERKSTKIRQGEEI